MSPGMLRTDKFIRFGSAADQPSNYGVELWVHLERPFATFGHKKFRCSPDIPHCPVLLEDLRLFLPSAFQHSMWGPGDTLYVRRNASWARSDFVALPLEWREHQIWTWVNPQVSAGHACVDHLALLWNATVDVTGLAPPAAKGKTAIDAAALRDPKNADAVCDILHSAPEIQWQVNVHLHGAMVGDCLYKELSAAFPWPAKRCAQISSQRTRNTFMHHFGMFVDDSVTDVGRSAVQG